MAKKAKVIEKVFQETAHVIVFKKDVSQDLWDHLIDQLADHGKIPRKYNAGHIDMFVMTASLGKRSPI